MTLADKAGILHSYIQFLWEGSRDNSWVQYTQHYYHCIEGGTLRYTIFDNFFYLMKGVGLLWSVKCSRDLARTMATCRLSTSRNVKYPSARD